MAAAERRRGRRDNGLDATDWRAIEDLDPRVSTEVLDLLAAHGIPAYVQPAVDVDPVTRSATLPSRPADRLYVDRSQVKAARGHLRGLFEEYQSRPAPDGAPVVLPEPGGTQSPATPREPTSTDSSASDPAATDPSGTGRGAADRSAAEVDATFAGIVAAFDRQVDATAAAWPAAENLPAHSTGEQSPVEPARPTTPVDAREFTEPSLLDALDTFGADLPQEAPERFIPPPPPPLPRLSRQTILGWCAIVVGLVLMIGRPSLLPLDRSTSMLLGFAAILGGAVALILRLRPGTDPEDDNYPDDGARV